MAILGNSGNRSVNSNIQLNPNLLMGRSFEYGMSVILHETVHGIMELKGQNSGTTQEVHERMMIGYFDILMDALIDATSIPYQEAGALTLNGFGSVYISNPNLFNSKKQSLGLTSNDISSIVDDYKNKSKGSSCD